MQNKIPLQKKKQLKAIFFCLFAGEERVHFTKESNLNNQTVEVTKDVSFNLNCSVAGKPEPTIQWLKVSRQT